MIDVFCLDGPSVCGANLSDSYIFPFATNQNFTICAIGNPPPELEFNFGGVFYPVTRKLMNWKTHQYEFELHLPKFTAFHCGKKLNYVITSKIKPAPAPIKRELTIFVKGKLPFSLLHLYFSIFN